MKGPPLASKHGMAFLEGTKPINVNLGWQDCRFSYCGSVTLLSDSAITLPFLVIVSQTQDLQSTLVVSQEFTMNKTELSRVEYLDKTKLHMTLRITMKEENILQHHMALYTLNEWGKLPPIMTEKRKLHHRKRTPYKSKTSETNYWYCQLHTVNQATRKAHSY